MIAGQHDLIALHMVLALEKYFYVKRDTLH